VPVGYLNKVFGKKFDKNFILLFAGVGKGFLVCCGCDILYEKMIRGVLYMENENVMNLILAELKDIKGELARQGEVQAQHGEVLEHHSQVLEHHSQMLEHHSQMLEHHSQMLEQHGQVLSQHGDALSRLSHSVAAIEQNHGRSLGALHDGYSLLYDKLAPLPDAVRKLQDDMSIVKNVVASHSRDIKVLRKAE